MGCGGCGPDYPFGAGCGTCSSSSGQCCCGGTSCCTTSNSGWSSYSDYGSDSGCGNTDGSCPDSIGPCDKCQRRSRTNYRSCCDTGNCNCPTCNNTHSYTYRELTYAEQYALDPDDTCAGIGSCNIDCTNNVVPDDCSDPGTTGCAYIDDCNNCVHGNTGLVANYADIECGCDESGPINYWYDSDGDMLGSGSPTQYCTVLGSPNPNSGYIQEVPGYPNPCPGGGVPGWCTNNEDDYPTCTSNTMDDCNVCDGLNVCDGTMDSNTCIGMWSGPNFDCEGVCYGSSTIDDCSECNSPSNQNSDQDCNGDCFGDAEIDDCGICSGGEYGHIANSDMDECGVCNGDNSTCVDCAGVPNGDAFIDDCNRCICGSNGETCDDQEPNCKSESEKPECSGLEGTGPDLDCNNTCYNEPNYGAILDNCGECSDNDGSYEPYYANTNGVVGHVYDSDRDCGGICNPSTPLCDGNGCADGCNPDDNSCDTYMGNLGENGVDDCSECRGDNYDCTYPYLDLDSDNLWFNDGCTCGGCVNNLSSIGYTDNSPGFYDASSSIDNGSCRYIMTSRVFQSNEGGVLVSPDNSNVWIEIVPNTFNSSTTVTLEKIELDMNTVPLLPEGDEFNNNMMYRFHADTSPNNPIRIVMGYDGEWDNPKFIRMSNIVGEASDGNNYHDKWVTLNPASQTSPSFNDCNYNGGESCTDNYLGYIDVSYHQLYFTIGNIHNNIVYGCTDEIAMNYNSNANVQYQPLDCISGDVPTSGCCIYFDTQCPTGMSGITDFPAIYIEGGIRSYVGFTLPPRDDGESYDLSTIIGLSIYSENPDEYDGDISEIRITDLEEFNNFFILTKFSIDGINSILYSTRYIHTIGQWVGSLNEFRPPIGYVINSPTSMWLKFTFEDEE